MRISCHCRSCNRTGPVTGSNAVLPKDPTFIAPLLWEHNEVRTTCSTCARNIDPSDMTLTHHDMPVAVGLLTANPANGRILAVSRKSDHTAFGLPGGKVDAADGEINGVDHVVRMCTLRRAVAREVGEEVGIPTDALKAEHLVLLHAGVCPGGTDGIAYWMYTFEYTAPFPGEPTTQPGEGTVAWVDWMVLETGPFPRINTILHGLIQRGFPPN